MMNVPFPKLADPANLLVPPPPVPCVRFAVFQEAPEISAASYLDHSHLAGVFTQLKAQKKKGVFP